MIQLKTCPYPGCTIAFPIHFYNDYCLAHETAADRTQAGERARTTVARGPEHAVIRTLQSCVPDDAHDDRARMLEALDEER